MKRIIILSLLFFTATQKANEDTDTPSYAKRTGWLAKRALSLAWHLGQVASGIAGEVTALYLNKTSLEKLIAKRNNPSMRISYKPSYEEEEDNTVFMETVISTPTHIAALTTLKCGLQGLYEDLNIKGLINYLGKKLIKHQEEEAA